MNGRKLAIFTPVVGIASLILLLTGALSAAARTGPAATPATGNPTSPSAPATHLADAENVELVGHIEGATHAVFVQGAYAYAGQGTRLVIVDVSSPISPTVVDQTHSLSDVVQDVCVSGGYAYVAAGNGGLRVVDVSAPISPTEVGSYDTPGHVRAVAVAEGYAYVVDGSSGLRVIDVTYPTIPMEVGFYDLPGCTAMDVAVGDGTVYIACGEGGLCIPGSSNLVAPMGVACYDTPAYGVTVAGSYIYVAAGDDGLRVLDGSTLIELGSCDTPGFATDVAVAMDNAYVADGDAGLRVITVSNPATPAEVGFYDTPGYARRVAAAGNYAYIADRDDGLLILRYTLITDGDAYEPDDLCAQASPLTTDSTVQVHTFHDYADADWAAFTVVSGTTYVLQATSTSPGVDLVLELYDACGGNLEGSDDDPFGINARIIFTASAAGVHYVKALNHDPVVYGPDVTYELAMRAVAPGAVALIVAGHDDSYHMQDHILYAANFAYRTFLHGGIPKTHIRYLSAVDDDSRTDADGDGVSDVYAPSASANVEAAIATWATNLTGSAIPFYLYLVDHGGGEIFFAHGSSDTITPGELDAWLSVLEAATGAPVNVIYEACMSGSFIDGFEEISRPGRVVIASTGAANNAYALTGRGTHFSDAFFTALRHNQDLYASFQWGVAAVEATELWQTPWLDDDGDGVPNTAEDGAVAQGRGLFGWTFPCRWPPVIGRISPPARVENGMGIIRAQVWDDTVVTRVWMVIYPPSFIEPEPSGTMPDLGLPAVLLFDSNADGEYVGMYDGFIEDGVYRLLIYAKDGEGNLSQPGVLEVRTRWPVYLPLVLR